MKRGSKFSKKISDWLNSVVATAGRLAAAPTSKPIDAIYYKLAVMQEMPNLFSSIIKQAPLIGKAELQARIKNAIKDFRGRPKE